MELLGKNPSMQDLIEKLNEVVGNLNDSMPTTDSEIAEVKKLVSFGSDVLAGRLNSKLWYFKTQELMTASTELCEGDSCFVLNDGASTGNGTFEYWYVYKTDDVADIIDSYVSLYNPDLVAVKLQDMTLKDIKERLSLLTDQSTEIANLGNRITNLKSDTDALKSTTEASLRGKADLVDGMVPAAQLPSYVDDIIEGWLEDVEFPENVYAKEDTNMTTPLEPEFSKIYVNLFNNRQYRWGGSFFTEVSKSLAIGETSATAFAGDRGVEIETRLTDNLLIFMPISREVSVSLAAGDCTAIITKHKKVILIDTGASHSYSLIKEVLESNDVQKIDYLIISHYHGDHCQNLSSLSADFDMSTTTYLLPKHTDKFVYSETDVLAIAENNTIIYPDNLYNLEVDSLKFTFFNCNSEDIVYYDENSNNYNDYSMCCYCECGNTRILFTGDISPTAQARIYANDFLKPAQILKVEHHGYDAFVNTDYLFKVKPTYAVISEAESAFSTKQTAQSQVLALLNSMNTKVACCGKESVYVYFNESEIKFLNDYEVSSQYNGTEVDVYVDDSYTGISTGSADKPFRTLKEAIGFCKTVKNISTRILFKSEYNSEESLVISDFSGKLCIGDSSSNSIESTIKSLRIENSTVQLYNLNISGAISGALTTRNSVVLAANVKITGDLSSAEDYSGRGLLCYTSRFHGINITISNKRIAIFATENSTVAISELKGDNNTYGILSSLAKVNIVSSTLECEHIHFSVQKNYPDDRVMGDTTTWEIIKTGEDLNNLTTPGIYMTASGTITLSCSNIPKSIGYAFTMKVSRNYPGILEQFIHSRNLAEDNTSALGIWIRTYDESNKIWSSWKKIQWTDD